jgi:hypothetical protein
MRRRPRTEVYGGGVLEAYAEQLRQQWEGRFGWSHFARIVDRIDRGETVVVPAWAVRRWTGLPAAAFGGPEHVELRPDGGVVPVVPVKVGVNIVAWEAA